MNSIATPTLIPSYTLPFLPLFQTPLPAIETPVAVEIEPLENRAQLVAHVNDLCDCY